MGEEADRRAVANVSTAVAQNGSPRDPAGRLGPRWYNWPKALIGLPPQRRLARAALVIDAIRHWAQEFGRLSDEELKQQSNRLRGRARGGESLDQLLPEAFGLVCVAAERVMQIRLFDVQLAGGFVMHQGGLAEMATGEGKTVTTALPAYLNALEGKGVHLTTVNDYLARRDAEVIGPIHQALGLTVGYLQQDTADEDRAAAYRCDITYGTAAEFGFDFLRDRLSRGRDRPATVFWDHWGPARSVRMKRPKRIQRERPHYAIVDEADSIFIDEARSPLIISNGPQPATEEMCQLFHWADRRAKDMVLKEHFTLDEKKDKIDLTDNGKKLVRYGNAPHVPGEAAVDRLHDHVERAIRAHHRLLRDQHYLVEEDEIILVDESTGRRMPDRQLQKGLHQALQTKENLPITKETEAAAQVTFQRYFGLYKKLCGLTGTAWQNLLELRRVYKLWVVPVPSNRPVRRQQLPDRVFPTVDAKFSAVVEDVQRLHAQGRPVLIGTSSVEASEELSQRLTAAGLEHQVLNARFHAQEAEIVARAGQRGQVTVATNMAGRGTDIKLGPGVAELGGLHVLGTQRHEALRVDRQLAGRAGRQGDPGSCQFFLSLEDDLLEALGPKRQAALKQLGREGGARDWQQYAPLFRRAQRRVERRHRQQRLDVINYDKQRQEVLKDLAADPFVD
jgi:preprotein translocase subunit SecA